MSRLSSVARATLPVVCLLGLGALGCGSSGAATDDPPGVGPDRIPDEAAHPTLRNDCLTIAGKVLSRNVGDSTGDGPISRFVLDGDRERWLPIVGTTSQSDTSSGSIHRLWTHPDRPDASPVSCPELMSTFRATERRDGDETVYSMMSLEHEVLDFAYPKDLASAPRLGTPIPVKVASTLHIEYQRPWRRPDGTIDPDTRVTREGDAQSWRLESSCEVPFTVTPFMEPLSRMPSAGASFCQPKPDGTAECLAFRFDYVGDECSFVVRDASIKLLSGATVNATFAGYFERDARAEAKGYSLRVTNVEIR